MPETRNIVVLGGSVAGLSAAHYLLKHTLPKLQQVKDVKYELHIIDQSTHFWWHISAPRAIVSTKEIKHSDAFVPIMAGFKQYPAFKDAIHFHQGTIEGVHTALRQVSFKTSDEKVDVLDYYALIIATGIRSPTPLTTLHGDHTVSQKALDDMNAKLASAKDIVIGGGGPIGVETAGELGAHLKGKAKITLIAGSKKLLPILGQKFTDKAQKQLEKNGVEVKYGVRVKETQETSDKRVEVKLDNGESLLADVYIPAVGVTPNTEFLPKFLKQENGYVKVNPATLRVDEAGDKFIYAVGDVAGVDQGGVLNFFKSFPVAAANMSHDLCSEAKAGMVPEKRFSRKDSETQLVPIGAKAGLGAFNGHSVPSMIVKKFKGKDYMLSQVPKFTEGKQWSKP
ncbi:hypothetical protein BDY17DRAFT_323259 [Neohortaea acidophila]|uniref:FAD/NAD(P)-binding domain-containing protein n=1 Tax=Neohortaea acidophila TaxID=245834 RepID=A0A6A6PXC0_9PEZI|nr:uncharacterized protein BDY17DRAFT_323259 [Neohortaea acidophila]KAF2484406.1 hypothetical protein BDY17DRAFT_323259 [Neohortaea acidophila]